MDFLTSSNAETIMANQRLPVVIESIEDTSSECSEDPSDTPLLGHSTSYSQSGHGQNRNGQHRKHRPFDWCSCIGCVASFAAVILVAAAVAIPLVCVQLSNRRAQEAVLNWHPKETMKVDDLIPVMFTGFHLNYESNDAEYVASGFLFDQCPPLAPEHFAFKVLNKPVSNTEAYIVYLYLRRGSQVNVTFCTDFSLLTSYMYILKGDENYEKWLSFAELNFVKKWKSSDICASNVLLRLHTFDVDDGDFYFFLFILDYFSIQAIATVFANFTVQSMQYNTSAIVSKDHCTVNSTTRECAIYVPSGVAYGDCAVITLDRSDAAKSYHYKDIHITHARTLNVWLVVIISLLGLGLVVVVSVLIICCVRHCRRRLAIKRKAASELAIQ